MNPDHECPSTSANTRKRASSENLNMYRNKRCRFCGESCQEVDAHLLHFHPEFYTTDQIGAGDEANQFENEEIEMKLVNSAFDEGVVEYSAELGEEIHSDLVQFYDSVIRSCERIMINELQQKKEMKIFSSMKVRFSKINSVTQVIEIREQGFTTFAHRLLHANQVRKVWNLMREKILNQIEFYTEQKSGWSVDQVLMFSLTILHYPPLFASYFVELPYPLNKRRKCLRNVDNSKEGRDKCFLWSILAHDELEASRFKNDRNNNRSKQLKLVKTYLNYQNLVEMNGISYPVQEPDWKRFEKLNENICLTIIAYDCDMELDMETSERLEELKESKVTSDKRKLEIQEFNIIKARSHLVYASNFPERPIKVDLLLLMSKENSHYVLISNLSAFRANPNYRCHREICRRCLHPFKSLNSLSEHEKYCLLVCAQETAFPDENVLKFRNYDKTVLLPFAIHLDFESFLKPIYGPLPEIEAKSRDMAMHLPSGYFWWVEDHLGKLIESKVNRVSENEPLEDVPVKALRELVKLSKKLDEKYEEIQKKSKTNMVVTEKELEEARALKICCICKESLGEDETSIVKHHNHLEPFNFFGLAHNNCNLNARLRARYPVFMHNGENYDFHFLVKACAKLETEKIIHSVHIIPKSSEKYLCITINRNLVLLDSLCFAGASLSSLAEKLLEGGKGKFKAVQQAFENGNVDLLLKGKGLYPYTLMKGVDDFNRGFPTRDEFFNDLTEEEVNEEAYEHAKQVWKEFACQNMGDWHDLYVKLDTTYLADIMRELRGLLYKKYELDMYQYLSIPMLSFDCMLKYTKVELEYIKCPNLHLFWELSIRGGICAPGSLRHARANNKYMYGLYNSSEPSTYILYIDANNLYGKAMSEHLPTGSFEFLKEKELEMVQREGSKFVCGLKQDAEYGFMLEVSLEIPKDDKYNCYPPCPVKRTVKIQELSANYQLPLMESKGLGESALKVEKLITDLYDKDDYIVHYKTLQLYLSMGVKIKQIKRVLKFKQSPFLKGYIEQNTIFRNAPGASAFEKDFWKLMNNSVFGKTIENKRNRQNIRLVFSKAHVKTLVKLPTFASIKIIENDLAVVRMKKMKVCLDTPIYVGASILDLAKHVMYEFHYGFAVATYGSKAKLVYSDTDSYIYHITCENVFEDIKNSDWFDNSKYDPKNPLFGEFYNDKNKDVLGKFKDEYHNKIIIEIAAPRPKMYAIRALELLRSEDGYLLSEVAGKRAKGIPKSATKNQLQFKDYSSAIYDDTTKYVRYNAIRSKDHSIFTQTLYKKGPDGFCTKRFWAEENRGLAFGHPDIPKF